MLEIIPRQSEAREYIGRADQVVTVDLERGIARGWLENTEEETSTIESRDSGRTMSNYASDDTVSHRIIFHIDS